MTPFLRKLLGQNWLIVVNMLALAIFGVIAIYSATYMRQDPVAAEFWRKHANWVAVGFLAFILTRRSVFAGVLAGELALVAGGYWF